MEIAAYIGLHSIGKKDNTVISIALWVAVSAHAFAWFYWQPIQKITPPELPDWINIKLVAGFEEQQTIKEPQVKPVIAPRKKPVPVKQVKKKSIAKPKDRVAEVKPKQSPSEVIEEEVKAASASTFVKADSRPFALDNPKPVYPSAARRRGMQGVVLLQVKVSDKGSVAGIHIMRSSGFQVLDIAATNSVKQWQFMPAQQNDKNVASTVQVPIRFILNNS